MPSEPAVMVILPSLTATLSFPLRPSLMEVTVSIPPVMTRSSLLTMPWAVCPLTVRLPLPLMVRSVLV